MNPQDINDVIDILVERLGPTGIHVYELAVRQAFITGMFWSVIGLAMLTGVLITDVVLWRKWQDDKRVAAEKQTSGGTYVSYLDKADPFGYLMIGLLVNVLGGLVVVFALWYGISYVFNPEWAAIRLILGR